MAFAAKWALCPGCGYSRPLDREARLVKRLWCAPCKADFDLVPELLLAEPEAPELRHVKLPRRVRMGESFLELRPLVYDQGLMGVLTGLSLALIPGGGIDGGDLVLAGSALASGVVTWRLRRVERRQRIELAPGRLIVIAPEPRELPLGGLAGMRVYRDHLWLDFDGEEAVQLGQHVHLQVEELRALASRLRLMLARFR